MDFFKKFNSKNNFMQKCRTCGNSIKATRVKEYCSGKCRIEFNTFGQSIGRKFFKKFLDENSQTLRDFQKENNTN